MKRTEIVNLRDQQHELGYVRIDRRSDWGNPYMITTATDRQTVIEQYRTYLMRQIESGEFKLDDIAALSGKRLACWCAPEPCHGHVLGALADRLAAFRPPPGDCAGCAGLGYAALECPAPTAEVLDMTEFTYPDDHPQINGLDNLRIDATIFLEGRERYRMPQHAGQKTGTVVIGPPAKAALLMQPILQERRFAHRRLRCWYQSCSSSSVGRDYQLRRVSCATHWRG